ncbi:leucine-rich repeat-containing protein 59 [Petromyzon marinus]|uniref:Leucine-rich repeat-containing protein 59 n=1 Tax=Petromyzon marinus TaxID=7757 RepID=A0AAJ7TH73_PETMA|nr:leucine-rich repeat-containing protein 59 [Petromyzon marinus]
MSASAAAGSRRERLTLRDKLEGRELDLSLCGLAEAPVRELAELPKATVLDLSCNLLTSLQPEFSRLTHLVKLDLSKNQLRELPAEFGELVWLHHLDLFQNKLQSLPTSFAQLKSLKWLDLKDNPLEPALAKVTTDCLDEKQCKLCAVQVVEYMKQMQAEEEKAQQQRLEKERSKQARKEAELLRQEEAKRELRKQQKAMEKEKRRREYEEAQAQLRQRNETPAPKPSVAPHDAVVGERRRRRRASAGRWSCRRVPALLFLVLVLGGLMAGLVLYCQGQGPASPGPCDHVNRVYAGILNALRQNLIFQYFLEICHMHA